jgi:hypothetical protein
MVVGIILYLNSIRVIGTGVLNTKELKDNLNAINQ